MVRRSRPVEAGPELPGGDGPGATSRRRSPRAARTAPGDRAAEDGESPEPGGPAPDDLPRRAVGDDPLARPDRDRRGQRSAGRSSHPGGAVAVAAPDVPGPLDAGPPPADRHRSDPADGRAEPGAGPAGPGASRDEDRLQPREPADPGGHGPDLGVSDDEPAGPRVSDRAGAATDDRHARADGPGGAAGDRDAAADLPPHGEPDRQAAGADRAPRRADRRSRPGAVDLRGARGPPSRGTG